MAQFNNPRILLISGWYYPDSVGGTEQYVNSLGRELRSLGWNVTVASPSVDEEEHNYTYAGLFIYRYPVCLKPTKAEVRSEVSPKYFEVFEKWLKENRPDIVHIHSRTRGCGLYHAELVRQLGIPLVLTIHAADFMCAGGTSLRWGETPCDGKINDYLCTSCWIAKYGVPRFLALILSGIPSFIPDIAGFLDNKLATAFKMRRLFLARRKQMFRLFSLSDHIIAVSNWLQYALYLNGVPQSKISLCRHGLPPELIKIRTNYVFKISDPIRIGFIGRFNHVKGVHILIKAFKKLPLNKRVELRLYGRANLEEEEIYLRQLKKLSHNDKRILFCGELTSENREEVLNTIDVLAVPSIWFETGPFVVLEAFAAGIPVIGSNLGGIGELVVDKVNGLLVKTGDVRAWTAALRWVCEYPKSVMDWRSHIPVVRTVKEVVSDMSRIYEALLVKKEK